MQKMERFIRFLFGRVEKLNMFLLSWREMWLPIDTMCTAGDLSLGQKERQVVASGPKLNLLRDLRWVVKRTRKFPRKYT